MDRSRSLDRLARITTEVERATSRELVRRVQELEHRLEAPARPSAAVEADAIRVRTLEGRLVEADAALRGVREELRDLRARVEGLSTETLSRIHAFQLAQQEAKRLLDEKAGPLRALEERVRAVEQATGQMAAQAESLTRSGEEMAAVLEELKKETGKWEDLGEVLIGLRKGLESLQKEAAKLDALQKRSEAVEAHGRELERIASITEGLLKRVEELGRGPPEAAKNPEVERRLEEHEKALQKFSGVAEEVLRGLEAMEEQRRVLEGALKSLRENPYEERLKELELAQAKVMGVVEVQLKQADEMEAAMERLRRVVLQQAAPRTDKPEDPRI